MDVWIALVMIVYAACALLAYGLHRGYGLGFWWGSGGAAAFPPGEPRRKR